MINKLPFSDSLFQDLAQIYGTPLYIYDEAGIRGNIANLRRVFGWRADYTNYFAVKATPTPAILKIMAETDSGFDCSSLAELKLVEMIAAKDRKIFYTSNNTTDADYRYAASLGAIVNLDKVAYLKQILAIFQGTSLPPLAFRYNPGFSDLGNDIIGRPDQSKFGDGQDQIMAAARSLKSLAVKGIGLHIMLASNERDPEVFKITAKAVSDLAKQLQAETGISIDFINLGGGIGIDYRPTEEATDIDQIGANIRAVLEDAQIPIYTECGRYVTGPNGYLLATVRHDPITSGQKFLPVDVSINNINRLATVDGAYHHLTALGHSDQATEPMTVVGSMCTNDDRLFIDRQLPTTITAGDLVVIHDAGAHCRADTTNYNGQLRAGEVLVKSDGSHEMIRRPESLDDLFATIGTG